MSQLGTSLYLSAQPKKNPKNAAHIAGNQHRGRSADATDQLPGPRLPMRQSAACGGQGLRGRAGNGPLRHRDRVDRGRRRTAAIRPLVGGLAIEAWRRGLRDIVDALISPPAAPPAA
jgi:hypothetical protein